MRRPVLAVVLLVAAGACSREPAFADRTARLTVGDRTTTFTVDACGLDGQTFRLAARAESGAVLQAVVGVEDDGETGVPESTGITVFGYEQIDLSAFGDESWARRGMGGEAPGEVTSARIRGARIQASAEAVAVDADERPLGDATYTVRLDARCDEED